MKMQTSELQGAALDWVVAKCEGWQPVYTNGSLYPVFQKRRAVEWRFRREYSTEWSEGGPIIEREGITVRCIGRDINGFIWDAAVSETHGGDEEMEGPTPLIAAMRCYVASKLGPEVDVPEELK